MGGAVGGRRMRAARESDGVVVFCGADPVPVPMRWDRAVRPAADGPRALTDSAAFVRRTDGEPRAVVAVLGDEALTRVLSAGIARRHIVAGVRVVGVVRRLVVEDAFALRDAVVGEIVSELRSEAAVARACREFAFPPSEDAESAAWCDEAARIADALVGAPPFAAVSEAAARLGISRRRLRELCMSLTGMTPRELRSVEIARRVGVARRSGWTIERIAAELGYSDGPTLIRATTRAGRASSILGSRKLARRVR